MFWSNNFFTFG